MNRNEVVKPNPDEVIPLTGEMLFNAFKSRKRGYYSYTSWSYYKRINPTGATELEDIAKNLFYHEPLKEIK